MGIRADTIQRVASPQLIDRVREGLKTLLFYPGGGLFKKGFPVLDHITLTAHGTAMVYRHPTACAVLALNEGPAKLEFCANRT